MVPTRRTAPTAANRSIQVAIWHLPYHVHQELFHRVERLDTGAREPAAMATRASRTWCSSRRASVAAARTPLASVAVMRAPGGSAPATAPGTLRSGLSWRRGYRQGGRLAWVTPWLECRKTAQICAEKGLGHVARSLGWLIKSPAAVPPVVGGASLRPQVPSLRNWHREILARCDTPATGPLAEDKKSVKP